MTIEGFFLEGGVRWGILAGEGRNRWNDRKKEPFEAKHQKEYRLNEMPFPPKTLKSSPRLLTHIPSSLGFEPGGMLSVAFEKWQRRGRTVHRSETLVFSLFGETYLAGHITISAWKQRMLSVDPRFRAAKTDNTAKWCPSLTDLMFSCGLLYVDTYTAFDNQPIQTLRLICLL